MRGGAEEWKKNNHDDQSEGLGGECVCPCLKTEKGGNVEEREGEEEG